MEPIINNTIRVKEMNQELVRQTLRTLKQAKKSTVARETGLSVATCGSILNEMLAAGELIELDAEESSGGRPAKVYQYNMNFCYIACLIVRTGIQGHSLEYRVANLAGEAVDQGLEERKRVDAEGIEAFLDELIARHPDIRAVGIGVPGAVHQGVINVSDIAELVNVPLEEMIREKHGIEVILENDMNLTVYGFYHKQDDMQEKTIAVATFIEGSLPGAGMMVEGHIHRGSTRFAGEIAFLPFGLSQEEQFRQLHDRSTFCSIAARAVSSLIAVLNPEMIALTGSLMRPGDVEQIRQECLNVIPAMHMPKLLLLEHPDEDYMYGLIRMTLESLTYSLKLVEKRR
ncbi:ROK family protein [Paenibacillus pinistramenti]|uniref:ROK family protein n=1 Tax=Paenibacillus pinistramenti TaxID=1768003 RepID=UPI001108BDCA|nr:ROK family protein [Paenibacillus pinistramenti]